MNFRKLVSTAPALLKSWTSSSEGSIMHSTSFTFESGQYDNEFEMLYNLIGDVALATEGFIQK